MRLIDFDPKAPAEIVPLVFDFAKLTSDIATIVITLTVKRGTDAGIDLVTLGSNQVVESEVRQLVQNGLSGVIYLARCDITNAAGEKYSLGGYLPVCEID